MRRTIALWLVLLLAAAIAGCGSTPRSAPVAERTVIKKGVKRLNEPDWRPKTYTVQKGDTLYAIALEHGFDYRELAEWNGIADPNLIRVGQSLRLTSPQQQENGVIATPLAEVSPVAESKPMSQEPVPSQDVNSLVKTQPKAGKIPYSAEAEKAPLPAVVATQPTKAVAKTVVAETPKAAETKPAPKPAPVASEEPKTAPPALNDDDDPDWGWPAKGKLVGTFNEGSGSKGVDIAGKSGQAVVAAAPGKVVYSGSGLRGYGKLVIIKHNKTYLSAYAHNSLLLVKEGQSVLKGQRIAEMGNSDADQVKLHFEIRRLGKPVDPLKHLPEG